MSVEYPSAGKMRWPIHFDSPSYAQLATGGMRRSWKSFASARAYIEDEAWEYSTDEGGVEHRKHVTFVTRWRGDLTPQMTVVYDGRRYDILSIEDPQHRRLRLRVTCKEHSTTTGE
jgi:SPP1 family predicted phage head-tail adaptor